MNVVSAHCSSIAKLDVIAATRCTLEKKEVLNGTRTYIGWPHIPHITWIKPTAKFHHHKPVC